VVGSLGWARCAAAPTLETILDRAVDRALNGDKSSERLLWETLADYLSDYRDLRVMLEHAREHTRA